MTLAKVCLLGEVSVGKTSLIRRFVDRTFSESYLSTVGVTISRKLIHLPASPGASAGEVQLIFWDLQGGHEFGAIASSYLKGAHAAVVVGDLTRNATLEALGEHINRFMSINPSGIVLVALNKADLHPDPGLKPAIDTVHFQAILKTFSTSAKTGEGVDDLFSILAAHLQLRVEHGSAH
jgi:small GTP-binding protein